MIESLTITMPLFVCFFWSLLIATDLIRKGMSRHRTYLLVFFVAATILYLGHAVFFSRSLGWMPLSDWMYSTCNLAVYPLWLLYICSLTENRHTVTDQLIIMSPTIIGCVAVGVQYLIMSPADTAMFVEQYLYNNVSNMPSDAANIQAHIHNACKVTFGIQLIPILYLGYKKIKRFNQQVNNIYADTENKIVPAAMHYLLVLFLIISIMSFIVNVLGRYRFEDSLLLAIPSLIFTLLLFAIGYISYFQEFSINDIKSDELEADDFIEKSTNLSELRERIEQVMITEKLYLQPNLKLHDLVRYVQSNRNYVYNAINKEMGVSFNEYVNRLRIDHSIRLIQQHPDMPLAEVAEKSGFTSIASFYRNFKLFTGKSPKEYSSGGKVRKPTDSDN